MGTVYQALDLKTNQRVAVKILHAKGANDAARFMQEAALLAELSHPAIVRYVDSGVTAQGDPYIAMEWLEGETLEDRLTRGPMPPGRAARLAARVLDGLALAHGKGIVHRDIKPSNVFLLGWRLSQAKLLDFGIARRLADPKRLTRQGSTVGTPMYASPEQARGERNLDGRADVFSLGCVLFECLAGEPPFTGDTAAAVMARICLGRAPLLIERLPGVDPQLAQLVQRMLTQDRAERPGDAMALAHEFNRVAARLDVMDSAGSGLTRSLGDEGRGRDVISEGEQRVMSLLMIRLPGTVATPRAAPGAPSANSRTRLMPTAGTDNSHAEAATVAALTGAVEPFGGRLDRLLDRSLVVTVPHLGMVTDQVEQVARLALRLRGAIPGAQFSIGTGRGVLLARLPVGDVVESAAGSLDRGAAGDVSLDETSARLLASRFAIDDQASGRRLGNELLGEDRARMSFGGPSPFFGRDREISSLRGLFEESVAESAPRTAVVLGAAGIGKSRLVHELLRRVQSESDDAGNVKVIALRAVSLRHSAPFLAIRRLLSLAGIDNASDVQPAQAREALRVFLRAQTRDGAVILLLDDLQHADLASVQLLEAALSAVRDCPVLFIGVARPEAEERFPTLFNERAALRLRLTALSRKGAETLLARMMPQLTPEAAGWALTRADGNAFLLEELARYCLLPGRDPLPQTVVGLVQAGMDAFGPDLKRVLRAASMLQSITRDALVALVGDRHRRDLDDWLQMLVDRGALERNADEPTVLRFRSPLLKEVAYQMLPPGDHALGRRLIRTFLEEAGRTIPEYLVAGNTATVFAIPSTSVAA